MADVPDTEVKESSEPQQQEPATSQESPAAPQTPADADAEEGNSPQSSPKRKPRPTSDSKDGRPEKALRQKTDRKPTWKTRLLNSLKRKGKRSDSANRRAVDLETSDFSFHQPSRVSPLVASSRKRGSPSLELHRGLKRRPHSFIDVEVREEEYWRYA